MCSCSRRPINGAAKTKKHDNYLKFITKKNTKPMTYKGQEQPETMKVICDFDGTTAINDVGNLLFRTFADTRCYDIVQSWKDGRINSKQCLQQECSIARVNRSQLQDFADTQKLDPTFSEFVIFCQQLNIEVEIASDGLDYYINRILDNHYLGNKVAAKANALIFEEPDCIRPEFPYFAKGCRQCGNCKGYHVNEAKKTHDKVVYIGDGMSDRCGARAADVVFAKRGRELIDYCKEHDIAHREYDDFSEIMHEFKTLYISQF